MGIRALAFDLYRKRLGFVHPHGLGGKHVLYFACPYTQRKRTKSAMSRSVTVSAHYRSTRQGQTKLRSYHMYYSLIGAVHIKERYAKLLAVLRKSLNLYRRNLIHDRKRPIACRDIVVHCGKRQVCPPDAPAVHAQPVKCLR